MMREKDRWFSWVSFFVSLITSILINLYLEGRL